MIRSIYVLTDHRSTVILKQKAVMSDLSLLGMILKTVSMNGKLLRQSGGGTHESQLPLRTTNKRMLSTLR